MRNLMKESTPEEKKFAASKCLLSRFKRRFHLSLRSRSNMKHKSTEKRLPEIRKFHRTVLDFRQPLPEQDDKLGRFRASSTYHQDQVPLQLMGQSKGKEQSAFRLKPRKSICWSAKQLCSSVSKVQVLKTSTQELHTKGPFTNAEGRVDNHKPFNRRIWKEFAQLQKKFPTVSIYIQKCAWMALHQLWRGWKFRSRSNFRWKTPRVR